jgi:hypothetical protein
MLPISLLILPSHNTPPKVDLRTGQSRKLIPIGKPYLTKVNGRLVMARDKSKGSLKSPLNLLGQVFGVSPDVVHKHKRSKSVEKRLTSPIVIGGVTYVPQVEPISHSAPLPQQLFPNLSVPMVSQSSYPQYPLQQHPRSFVVPTPTPAPTDKELKQLMRIDAEFNEKLGKECPIHSLRAPRNGEIKTIVAVIKHICTNCGRLRSKKYHYQNPIKPGDNPPPAFCRKCQRDASSTSCPDSEEENTKKKKKKKKKQLKKAAKSRKREVEEELSMHSTTKAREGKSKSTKVW